ncbi:MAG TPA: CDP-6-deoxy-delta-3,4-glucoseen reductase [Xanthomonadales bacterium]|nr:CDP-6-deoxy-delta-3,4-glucoseen reductase [Xanthomonadales bacterium]
MRLTPSGHEFSVAPGETVLEAARAQNLALPYSCLSGRCGSCKATVLQGEVRYHAPPVALSDDEQAHRQVLLCQAEPLTDLVVAAREVPSVADMPKRQLAVKVVERTLLAPDVMRLVLRPPAGQKLRWLAGQYLDVLLPGGKRRAFSIANAPERAERIELHIRRVTGGDFTAHVFDTMRDGEVLRVEGPLGTFVPREDSERTMLLVAGGTGFAPIKAIVEHFLNLGSTRPMHLYWGVRAVADLYLAHLPAEWRQRHPAFAYTPVLSDPGPGEAGNHRTGFVHEVVTSDHPDLSDFDVYMSGPPAMIDAARHAFVHARLDESRLYYDSFDYAPDVLAAIVAARAGLSPP